MFAQLPSRSKESAFTLIELLVVIVILAILMAIAIPAYLGQQKKAKDSEPKQYLTAAWKSARAAAIDNNSTYPLGATLIAEIQADHPHLSVTTATCSGATGTPKQIVIDPTSTAQNLVLCSKSASGTIQRIQATPTSSPTFSTTTSAPYSAAVLADSPSLHWRLNETGSPATVADNSGNGRTGTVFAFSLTTGIVGPITAEAGNTAFQFSYLSTTGRVVSAADATVFGTTTFSMEAWIRPVDTPGAEQIFTVGNASGSGIGLDWQGVGNAFNLDVGSGASYTGVITAATENVWHHVVITVSGTAIRFYIDGALVQSRTESYSAPTGSNAQLRIDQQLFDEVAWYPTALTLAQVQAHYNAAT